MYVITNNNIKQYIASSIIKCFVHTTDLDFNRSLTAIESSKYKAFKFKNALYVYIFICDRSFFTKY